MVSPMRWLFLLLPLGLMAAAPTPRLSVAPWPVPAAPGARGPSLALGPGGLTWLTWLEPEPAGRWALRVSTLGPQTGDWSVPHTVTAGLASPGSSFDPPSLTVGRDGAASIVWLVGAPSSGAGHGHDAATSEAWVSRSGDNGVSWSAPVRLTQESRAVEFPSLVALADGRVLAAWLDGRATHGGDGRTRLYSRIVGGAGPDTLLDPSVCDCCPVALTAFPDGGALVAYRGRTTDEVRDIQRRRFDGQVWEAARPLSEDGWKIPACPVNGARLASDGGRVAVAWYTGADDDPRVQVSFSADAGGQFLLPLRLDAAKPAGRVDTVLMRDGALLASWVSAEGGVWVRRVSPEFSASDALLVAAPRPEQLRAAPRLVLRRDYAGGGDGRAEVLVVFAAGGSAGGLEARRVDIPEGALLQAEAHCDCAPTPEQLRGWPIRGTVVRHDPVAGRVELRHPALPGIFPAGAHTFSLALPAGAPSLPEGEQVFARLEPAGDGWRLFDVRRMVMAPAGR